MPDDIPDTPLADDTDAMAEVTRERARRDDPDEGTTPGSRDMPGGNGDDGYRLQHQQGTGQSDGIDGQAPAASMAQQRVQPADKGRSGAAETRDD